MKINFVTGNSLKFEIAKQYFAKINNKYELVQLKLDTPEIQSESVEEVARHSAVWAAHSVGEPCIKMDVGFEINALNGFPGPFVRYVNDWLSVQDYLNLMQDKSDRSASFVDVTAIGFPDGSSEAFTVKALGSIADRITNEDKWPASALFIPKDYEVPLGSMTNDEQVQFWGDGNWTSVIKYFEKSS